MKILTSKTINIVRNKKKTGYTRKGWGGNLCRFCFDCHVYNYVKLPVIKSLNDKVTETVLVQEQLHVASISKTFHY